MINRRADVDLYQAGKILRDPEAWEDVAGLSAEEKKALQREPSSGFWNQPKALRVSTDGSVIWLERLTHCSGHHHCIVRRRHCTRVESDW